MKIYPKDTFELDSPLTSGELYSAFDAAVEPPKWFRWRSASGKKYQGEFTYTNFKFWRIINYRNSFLPIIEGQITPSTSGSRIAVTMRLHRLVSVFMLIWFSMVIVGLVTFLIAVIKGKSEPIPALLIPMGMLIFGTVLTSGSFWWEAKKTKPFLIEIVKGTERQPTRE
jgi:hypothetical protein